jgi:hypothetical protein
LAQVVAPNQENNNKPPEYKDKKSSNAKAQGNKGKFGEPRFTKTGEQL